MKDLLTNTCVWSLNCGNVAFESVYIIGVFRAQLRELLGSCHRWPVAKLSTELVEAIILLTQWSVLEPYIPSLVHCCLL